MKIYIGADHNGFEMKQNLEGFLRLGGYEVVDAGDVKRDPEDDFPQFASRAVSELLADDDPDSKSDAIAIINPEIIPNASDKREGWEGCLSIPDIRGMVPRFTDITVLAFDRDGKKIELKLKDFPARVVQHETDHLDGVLFFDRMTSMMSLTYLEEYSRYHSRDDD